MLSFFEHIFVWANSRRGNIVYKCIGAKILHGAKITLFTVCVHWLSPWRCPSATLSRDNSNKQRGIRHFRLSIRQGQCQLRVKGKGQNIYDSLLSRLQCNLFWYLYVVLCLKSEVHRHDIHSLNSVTHYIQNTTISIAISLNFNPWQTDINNISLIFIVPSNKLQYVINAHHTVSNLQKMLSVNLIVIFA